MLPVIQLPRRDDEKISYKAFCGIIRKVNENLIFDGASFDEFRGGGKRIIKSKSVASGGAGIDETKECYGAVAGKKGIVTIWNPAIQHSSFRVLPTSPYFYDVAVLGGTDNVPHYVCAKYARMSTLQVVSPAFSTIPINSVEYFWFPILAVYLNTKGMTVIKYRLVKSMPIFPGEV
jgi:hypothetical protein